MWSLVYYQCSSAVTECYHWSWVVTNMSSVISCDHLMSSVILCDNWEIINDHVWSFESYHELVWSEDLISDLVCLLICHQWLYVIINMSSVIFCDIWMSSVILLDYFMLSIILCDQGTVISELLWSLVYQQWPCRMSIWFMWYMFRRFDTKIIWDHLVLLNKRSKNPLRFQTMDYHWRQLSLDIMYMNVICR